MTADEALAFVERHGVVLSAAKGPVPRLTEAIVGEPITGSWWGHARSHEIYDVLEAVVASRDVLQCRVVAGKITLVHRRLWPSLVAASDALGTAGLARVEQVHTSAGHHVARETPFPAWVDAATLAAASVLTVDDALDALGDWSRDAAGRAR